MEEDDNIPDERRTLYEEFVEEVVKKANSEAFFDEADLVEIFDYASDLDNYVVKVEVLLYGARHYPASTQLQTRRAWFYSSLGENEAAREVNSRVENTGVLNRLLDLRTQGGDLPSVELRHRLAGLINEADELVDEDLIQLVDLCADFDQLDFLQVLRPAIMERSSYPQTFLYQWADAAERAGNYGVAIPLFEELTMMEPFTLDFWLRLATAQGNGEHYQAAMQSAEMALALDPECVAAKRAKAFALYFLKDNPELVVELLKSVIASPEGLESDVSLVATTLLSLGREDEAVSVITEYLDTNPSSRAALDSLLHIAPDKAAPYLRTYLTEHIVETEATDDEHSGSLSFFPAHEWVRELMAEGQYVAAATIVNVHSLDQPFFLWGGVFFELNYINKDYTIVVDAFESSFHNTLENPSETHDPSIVLPYLLSLIQLGRYAHALTQCRRLQDNLAEHFDELAAMPITPYRMTLPSTRYVILDGYRTMLANLEDVILEGCDSEDPDTEAPTSDL